MVLLWGRPREPSGAGAWCRSAGGTRSPTLVLPLLPFILIRAAEVRPAEELVEDVAAEQSVERVEQVDRVLAALDALEQLLLLRVGRHPLHQLAGLVEQFL